MNYTFSTGLATPLLMHFDKPCQVVADHADDVHARLGALVASGDYFLALATRLDELSLRATADPILYDELQQITDELMHLQASYTIRQRPS